jgi:hypothetical protein
MVFEPASDRWTVAGAMAVHGLAGLTESKSGAGAEVPVSRRMAGRWRVGQHESYLFATTTRPKTYSMHSMV